jgi:hypothetical protein
MGPITLLSVGGIKGIAAIVCLAVAVGAISYSSTVTMTPNRQLTSGATTASWSLYVNEVDAIKYLPGGTSESILDAQNSSTYSFKVVTDTTKDCAIKIELQSAMSESKFSKFEITVRSSTGGAWGTETIYDATTGSNIKSSVDGLIEGDAGYVHQTTSTTKYYEIKVVYSFNVSEDTTPIPITLKFTPYPESSF